MLIAITASVLHRSIPFGVSKAPSSKQVHLPYLEAAPINLEEPATNAAATCLDYRCPLLQDIQQSIAHSSAHTLTKMCQSAPLWVYRRRKHLKAERSREAASMVEAEARPEATSWPTAGSMAASGAKRLGWLRSSPNTLQPPAHSHTCLRNQGWGTA